MDMQGLLDKQKVSLDEIRIRVAHALDRHPLCRGVEFDVISAPRTGRSNWTILLQQIASPALWEASDIVADIQEAYELQDHYRIAA